MQDQNVRIKGDVHKELADYCAEKGLKLGAWASEAIREKLVKEKSKKAKK
jgi:predicted HicB family RNase H-like nuclease